MYDMMGGKENVFPRGRAEKEVRSVKIASSYPAGKKRFRRAQLIKKARWLFLTLAAACAVVNLCVGGKAWSIVSIWGLYMLWTDVVSPDLVGYDRVHQSVKIAVQVSVMLFLIEVCLASGWAGFVLPIVGFSALAAVAALFFSDMERQRENVTPMLLLSVTLLLLCTVGVWLWEDWSWPMIVMAAAAFGLTAALMAAFGGRLWKDVRKYFHVK